MVAALPDFVADATAICGFLLAVAAVLALVLKMARPGFDRSVAQVIEAVTAPRFDALESSIAATDATLAAHTVSEEAQGAKVLAAVDAIGTHVASIERRLDAHLDAHARGNQ